MWMRELTLEQTRMLEDNHNLIYGFINRKGLCEFEWYELFSKCLVVAVSKHDASKGALSTFFNSIASQAYRKKYKAIKEFESEVNLTFSELTPDHGYSIDSNYTYLKEIISKLDYKLTSVLELIESGHTHREIANILDISKTEVGRRLDRARKEIRFELNRED